MQMPHYIFSKLGVSTNDAQLKANQLQLLKQSYENKQNSTYRNTKFNTENNSSWFKSGIPAKVITQNHDLNQPNQFFVGRSSSEPRLMTKSINQEIIKNTLSNRLNQQIQMKQRIKNNQIRGNLQLEKQLVKNNSNIYNMQVINEKDFLSSFKNQALHNIKMKQQKNKMQKMNQKMQKSLIDRQYRQANDLITKRLLGLNDAGRRKAQTSLQTYQQRQSILANPQSTLNIDPTNKSPYSYRIYNQELKKHKDHLKQILLQQIKIRQQSQKQQRIKKLNTPFVDQKYKIVDNPIFNPVDIKIAKDNPYIMKQLLNRKGLQNKTQIKSRMGLPTSKHSQLSGRISQLGRKSQLGDMRDKQIVERTAKMGKSEQVSRSPQRQSNKRSNKEYQTSSSYLSRRGSTSLLTSSANYF